MALLSGPRVCARTDVYRQSLSICRTNDRMSERGDPGAQGQAAEKPRASVPSGEQGQCRVCCSPAPEVSSPSPLLQAPLWVWATGGLGGVWKQEEGQS